MRYHLLATDYDGTLASDGRVDDATVASLKDLLATGRKLVLVTGRELDDLASVYPDFTLFERIVAENGAMLYRPATKERRRLAEPPPPAFVAALRQRGVVPLSKGEVIVATREPHEAVVLETIRELGLELQVIFNKGAVMVLPAGVNKATGLMAALEELKISPHNVVGVGDAENDHSFLKLCERSAAVASALPALSEQADIVLRGDAGAGVRELVAKLIEDDLAETPSADDSRALTFGADARGERVTLAPYGDCILVCGASASGKSTVARRIVESLLEHSYQVCIIDPEGDYEEQPGAVVLGGPEKEPSRNEIGQLLEDYGVNGVVCMTGVPISDRPRYFAALLTDLLQLRVRYGRPHWVVMDEAHHLMPAEWEIPNGLLPETLVNVLLVTVHPELLSTELQGRVTQLVAVGPTAPDLLRQFAAVRGIDLEVVAAKLASRNRVDVGEVLLFSTADLRCRQVRIEPPSAEQRRHTRKYAVGQLPPDRSFYFRGPAGKLNLRAQNLMQFLDVAAGVDEETWAYHLRRADYSRWFRDVIKDAELASAAAAIERDRFLSRADAFGALRTAVESRYTLPADAPLPVPGAS
jgi:hydroxymethylpyrimidine pyrophosphatase-like HAD family hydrolase